MATITGLEDRKIRTREIQPAEHMRYDRPAVVNAPPKEERPAPARNTLAIFCYEESHNAVGRFVAKAARAMAERDTSVHLFTREAFELDMPGVYNHAVGRGDSDDLLGQVHDFTRRACNAFLKQFKAGTEHVTLMGHEWSTIPAMSLLHGIKNVDVMLSVHSLERQRSDLGSDVGKWIEETELAGLREAKSILVHDATTAETIRRCLPECNERLVDATPAMPLEGFEFDLDPAEVKARFQVGPIDPTILYVGDLDERYGPQLLMKAMPEVIEKYPRARCIVVGDGELLWPLRVYSRYLLLDHAVRLVGHLADEALYELIHAADIVAVPSMDHTPWWPVEAAWAARRPVVATRKAASGLLGHGENCLVVEPDEKSLAAGIERILADPELGHSLAESGRAKVENRYSENRIATQIEQAMGVL